MMRGKLRPPRKISGTLLRNSVIASLAAADRGRCGDGIFGQTVATGLATLYCFIGRLRTKLPARLRSFHRLRSTGRESAVANSIPIAALAALPRSNRPSRSSPEEPAEPAFLHNNDNIRRFYGEQCVLSLKFRPAFSRRRRRQAGLPPGGIVPDAGIFFDYTAIKEWFF
jgi:hypothetical protein